MPDTPRISVKSLPSISLEEETNALAAVYALCLQKYREKEKANKPTPEPVGCDAKVRSSELRAKTIIPSE